MELLYKTVREDFSSFCKKKTKLECCFTKIIEMLLITIYNIIILKYHWR